MSAFRVHQRTHHILARARELRVETIWMYFTNEPAQRASCVGAARTWTEIQERLGVGLST